MIAKNKTFQTSSKPKESKKISDNLVQAIAIALTHRSRSQLHLIADKCAD
jgi:hypothetical protein